MERLARRWDHRVVTVVAGPGFGKTALLVSATKASMGGGGRDVWLSCEPADQAADNLVGGLAHAFGLQAGADFDAVLDAVWAQAPTDVCIVLDDVHEIPVGSEGAAILQRLATDMARNGHLVLASRDGVPLTLARVAASRQLIRVTEDDLLFDDDELAAFAASHGVESHLLASTGGWPALAELTASAKTDLVLDYLWEEVLARIGEERAVLLARFAAVRGGDDEVACAVVGRNVSVDDIVSSVPLVQRSTDGWAMVHPLWEPALRRLVTDEEATEARRHAASVHQARGRMGTAVDLFVEAEAWTDVLGVIRAAGSFTHSPVSPSADFGRWQRALPETMRREPEALLAAGLELQTRAPKESLATFGGAAEGFRARGDVDGELIAISHAGVVRWWLNDAAGLMALYGRVGELAAAGSARAQRIGAVGIAALEHLHGDSDAVLALLKDVDGAEPAWLDVVRWLRSVAYRRNGDVTRARQELDDVVAVASSPPEPQMEIARLRADWLGGQIDHVAARLRDLHADYVRTGDQFLVRESALELASKLAWLGDVERARVLIETAVHILPDTPNVVAGVLEVIARAAVAIADGDESGAATLLASEVDSGLARLTSPQGWYWRDRAAIALVHILVPETRATWQQQPLGPAQKPALMLAEAFEAARAGDLRPVRTMKWPDVGVVRAHLPVPWVVELAVAGIAARNPPADELLAAVTTHAGPALRTVVSRARHAPVTATAKRLLDELPSVPPYRLRIEVLGRLELWRNAERVDCTELRRPLVRELLDYLVARRRDRREAIGAELWPELANPAPSLRVTLNHLQRALQPDRARGQRPYFVRSTGSWLELISDERLHIDVWDLENHLARADTAERNGAINDALDAYRDAIPLWRGEPYTDSPYAAWAETERARLRRRYVTAAVRAGDLWLAADDITTARHAGESAIVADPTCEPAYRLLARTHVADGDSSAARRILANCAGALADLGVTPDPTTRALSASLNNSSPS
jgi:ATP/maltotriose-dependent transcriptional regulator MalT/DNA-binding SARP family transcriptional activator